MSSYFEEFQSRFIGIMQLDDCDALLQRLIDNPDNWYLYDTEDEVPTQTLESELFAQSIQQIKAILDEEHKERYCGIVYTDDLKQPNFVKVFHPNNLGKVCGSSENPPMPKWLISKTAPEDVVSEFGPKEEDPGFISKLLKL